MKHKVGNIKGKPLVVTNCPDSITKSELLISMDSENKKILDIKKREAGELVSMLNIDSGNSGGSTESSNFDMLIRYCVSSAINRSIYYTLDNSSMIKNRSWDFEQYVPDETTAVLDIPSTNNMTLTIASLNDNTEENTKYFYKILNRLKSSGVTVNDADSVIIGGDKFIVAELLVSSASGADINLYND